MCSHLKVCVLVVKKNEVLLIKEWSEKKNAFAWNTIKGTMDKENESVLECAIREAFEEANIKIELEKSLGVHVNYYGEDKYTTYFMFTAKIESGKPTVADNEKQEKRNENISETKWFDAKELSKLEEKDFVSNVSYVAVQKFLKGEIFDLDAISWANI